MVHGTPISRVSSPEMRAALVMGVRHFNSMCGQFPMRVAIMISPHYGSRPMRQRSIILVLNDINCRPMESAFDHPSHQPLTPGVSMPHLSALARTKNLVGCALAPMVSGCPSVCDTLLAVRCVPASVNHQHFILDISPRGNITKDSAGRNVRSGRIVAHRPRV